MDLPSTTQLQRWTLEVLCKSVLLIPFDSFYTYSLSFDLVVSDPSPSSFVALGTFTYFLRCPGLGAGGNA